MIDAEPSQHKKIKKLIIPMVKSKTSQSASNTAPQERVVGQNTEAGRTCVRKLRDDAIPFRDLGAKTKAVAKVKEPLVKTTFDLQKSLDGA